MLQAPVCLGEFSVVLQKCKKDRNLTKALSLHAQICGFGLETLTPLINGLLSLFVDVGLMNYAHRVFHKLPLPDSSSWSFLVSGYLQHGEPLRALILYEKAREIESVDPWSFPFVPLLKACGSYKDIKRGSQLHADIARMGLLEEDVFIGTCMIGMYAKIGCLAQSQEVFGALPVKNVVSWNALIAGYVEHGYYDSALVHFRGMHKCGVCADEVTLVCCLKACGNIGGIHQGQEIHDQIVKKGFTEGNVYIVGALVDMYAKCQRLVEAQEVFDRHVDPNVVLWTALISGYAEHGYGKEALICYNQMQEAGMVPNSSTFVCSLKACTEIRDTTNGYGLHGAVIKFGFEGETIVINTVIDMYAKCGLLYEAMYVFDSAPGQTIVSWTSLVSGLLDHGHDMAAKGFFEKMQEEGIILDTSALVCCLKVITNLGKLEKGHNIHSDVVKRGLLGRDISLGISLTQMYVKCEAYSEAHSVLHHLPDKTTALWNVLISGYVERGLYREVVECFEEMEHDDILSDDVTILNSFRVFGDMKDTVKCQEAHIQVTKMGCEDDLHISNAIVGMYAACGMLPEAKERLGKLQSQTSVSWTALIAANVQYGNAEEALDCFEQIKHDASFLNAVSYFCCLKSCGAIGTIYRGHEIHTHIIKRGLLETYAVVGSALVSMYVNLGSLMDAHQVHDKLPVRDLISWTAMIKGYMSYGLYQEVLSLSAQMQCEGISPDAVTYICSLSACGCIGVADKGVQMHSDIVKKGLEHEVSVANSLIDMHAKCGSIATAQDVFNDIPVQDVVSWNTMITGYAQFSSCQKVFHILKKMVEEKREPDLFTFVSVLSVCSHTGLIDEGSWYFLSFSKDYGLIPTSEHFVCIVDLFCRSGYIDGAVEVINKMPCHPGPAIWHALIGVCGRLGGLELARHAFQHAIGLNQMDTAVHVAISNVIVDVTMEGPLVITYPSLLDDG